MPFNKPIGRGSKAHYLHLKKTTRNVVREFAMVMVGNKSDVDILGGGAAIAATATAAAAAAAGSSLSGLGLGLEGLSGVVGERRVSTKEGKEAAKKLGLLAESWFETSASVTGENVDAVFEQVAREAVRNRKEYKEKKGEIERGGSEGLLKRDSEVESTVTTKSKVGGLWKSLTTVWLPLFGKKKG